ncbi:formate dehydrogenase accessory protein FdhE [Lampropedia aestuarii]|uniref:formate dehydrogenase accessory protein FdhE n=1 Tax=Lampropedia aestuarii TaxID=2562762 RepID=UPI0024691E68|nr:formate dehydrogenase accessory protein FdhE [Lampropedia aestuarii]MDH5856374.1 formate dehydrogenase accessory protein FdhE [Lampropedia aestuarii]
MQRILQPGEIEALDSIHFPRVRLPQPSLLFQERAARLMQLADGNPIADYLRFAARIVQAQQHRARALPTPEALPQTQIDQANANGMPLLSTHGPLPQHWQHSLRAMIDELRSDNANMPAGLAPVLERLYCQDDEALNRLGRQILAGNIGRDELAMAPLVMAALQVEYAHIAAHLLEKTVPYAEPATVCPVCGSTPVASVLRIGGQAAGHRYLHCSLCCTEWHMVRVKCSHCESTKGINYQGMQTLEGKTDAAGREVQDQVVLAETCDQCHTYRKIANQEKDPYAEPLADDLASLMLDLLMGESDFARASDNPLLAIEKPLAV